MSAPQDHGRPNKKKGEGGKTAGENHRSIGNMEKGMWETVEGKDMEGRGSRGKNGGKEGSQLFACSMHMI